MKVLILLALVIPLFSSTKLRVRLPSLPPLLSELNEITEKILAHGLNNRGFRTKNNKKIKPSTTAPTVPIKITTTTTSTTTTTTTSTATNTEEIERAVQSSKLVSLVTSFLKNMKDSNVSTLGFPSYLLTNLLY